MRMAPKLLLALLVAAISPVVSAMSLGEGVILSHVGEPLSISIPLSGDYGSSDKFYQVRSAECRSSVIGSAANGCDSLYEKQLSISVGKRSDGQYFLRVTGEKGDELYYHIVIKSVTAVSGIVYNSFDFLPEFKANPDVQSRAEPAVDRAKPAGRYGVVMGKVVDVQPEEASLLPEKKSVARAAVVESKSSRDASSAHKPALPVDVKPSMRIETRLQIKKVGEYADDIHALQKENGEIEEQIVLLEKHISLLKEVIRLKSQIGASGVADTGVLAAPAKAAPAIPVTVKSLPVANEVGMLTWILLFAVVVLSALLGWMFLKIRSFKSGGQVDKGSPSVFSPAPLSEKKSLDLTGAFVKPKW
jgi:hypothetical protein